MAQRNLPPTNIPVLDSNGQFSLPWRLWLQAQTNSGGTVTQAEIDALTTAVEAAQAQAEAAASTANSALAIAESVEVGEPNILDLLGIANLDGVNGVTSVALSAPAEFIVTGSPVTGVGTLVFTKATQTANTVWAGPTTGAASAPAFRALVAADIPSLSAVYDVAGSAATAQANAEAFSANANNLTSGTVGLGRLPVGSTFILAISIANAASTGDVGSVAIPAGIGDYTLAPSNPATAAMLSKFSAGAVGAITGTVRSAATAGGTALYTFTAVTPPATSTVVKSTAATPTVLLNASTTPTIYFNESITTATGTGTVLVPLVKLS